jgi:hypothetical protein
LLELNIVPPPSVCKTSLGSGAFSDSRSRLSTIGNYIPDIARSQACDFRAMLHADHLPRAPYLGSLLEEHIGIKPRGFHARREHRSSPVAIWCDPLNRRPYPAFAGKMAPPEFPIATGHQLFSGLRIPVSQKQRGQKAERRQAAKATVGPGIVVIVTSPAAKSEQGCETPPWPRGSETSPYS